MSKVFADTFYFLALMNPGDKAHEQAFAFSNDYRGLVVTTAWVVTEVGDAFCSPPFRPAFLNLIKILEANSAFYVHPPNSELFAQGIDLFRRRPDKAWSLTDCISFVLMESEGLTEALTGDHHFEQAGFVALLK